MLSARYNLYQHSALAKMAMFCYDALQEASRMLSKRHFRCSFTKRSSNSSRVSCNFLKGKNCLITSASNGEVWLTHTKHSNPSRAIGTYNKHTDTRAKRTLRARDHGIILLLVETSHFEVNLHLLSHLVSKWVFYAIRGEILQAGQVRGCSYLAE
jgi:hypothetical protein